MTTPLLRLLVLNPNTNPAVTTRVRAVAERVASPGTRLAVLNPELGPFSIETPADREAAVPQVLALIEAMGRGRFDACVLACFDDIAIGEARAMLGVPVVGTAEAGIAAARSIARRFAIITTVHAAIPTIHGLLDRYGARDLCTVRAAGLGVAAAAGDAAETEARIQDTIRAAIAEDGAEAILLGSGGLAGRGAALTKTLRLPVIDGVATAVKMAEGLASLGLCR